MLLEGTPFSHEVNFSTGLPVGAVVYTLWDNDSNPLTGYDELEVTPASGAVSVRINIPGVANSVDTPLFETRTLIWNYETLEGVESGSVQYRVEKMIPFPASRDGVRRKLGVAPHELKDDQIDILRAYADLTALYETDAFALYENSGDRNTLLVADAIEAMAGLNLIPSLQLSVAKREDSGTNSYERFAAVDWDRLIGSLTSYLGAVNDIVIPIEDITVLPTIFFTVERTDAITGA